MKELKLNSCFVISDFITSIFETKGKWLQWHYWMLYLIGRNCMVAKLQSLSRTSSTRCGSFKWRRELWKLKPSMAQYWFYTEDPSTDDRLLIYFPATSSPLEYCKKNICQYAPIMISWSVAIKNASVRAYCKVIGECPVILRMYKMLRSFDWQKYKNSWPNLVDWEKSTKDQRWHYGAV